MLKRLVSFAYGVLTYVTFLATFLYAVAFVGGVGGVPRRLDAPLQTSLLAAITIDCGLLTVFAAQHSIMARRWFKVWSAGVIPWTIERSTYVLCASLALLLLFWQWRPIGLEIWTVEDAIARAVLWTLFAAGWATVLVVTFLINHFDLFGLRQVWLPLIGRPYSPVPFRTPLPYRFVRHPLYCGFLLAFWSTPTMTLAHLLFAIATTAYIVLAIQFEERDLVAARRGLSGIPPQGSDAAADLSPVALNPKSPQQGDRAMIFRRCAPYVGLSALSVLAVAGTGLSLAVAEDGPTRAAAASHRHAADSRKSQPGELVRIVRESTERFRDPAVAEAEGYHLMFGCVSGPDAGAMGLHYVNMSLVGDGVLDATRPEIVIYEPLANGRRRLIGADYLLLAQAWDAQNAGPPQLMGQLLHLFEAPNRFGLPAFYTLHVWAWKESPTGTFVNWNHDVSCDAFAG